MNKQFTFTDTKIDAYLSMDELEGRRLVDRLAGAFIKSVPASLDDMDNALNGKDWEKIRFVSHKLISTCGNLGFTSMMELSIAIETSCASAEQLQLNQSAISENIKTMREHYQNACETLKKLNFFASAA